MSYSVTEIKYGWFVLASVVLGASIYIAGNQRKHVTQADALELVLGVQEHCLTTLIDTNPAQYAVAPLTNYVVTWYSNSYGATNSTVYTNSVTNTIGWRIDRDLFIALDAKILALIPRFYDTNTVVSGSNTFSFLTVTGLFSSLGIGNGVDKFTRSPCWTNAPATNYAICYTTFYPTGAAQTNAYTSAIPQAVSFATNYDGTNFYWATISNWPTVIVVVTNPAVFSNSYPWHVYQEDLIERYKILNALSVKPATYYVVASNLVVEDSSTVGWAALTAHMNAHWAAGEWTDVWGPVSGGRYGLVGGYIVTPSLLIYATASAALGSGYTNWWGYLNGRHGVYTSLSNTPSFQYTRSLDIYGKRSLASDDYYTYETFDGYGGFQDADGWYLISTASGLVNDGSVIYFDWYDPLAWCDPPAIGAAAKCRGFNGTLCIVERPNFLYCTNRFW